MIDRCRRRGCGSRKVERMDEIGRIQWVCLPCKRNARGLCRDCPAPIYTKRALRCERCATARRRKLNLEHHKRAYRQDPKFRAEQLEKSRRYRNDPKNRERLLKYGADYRASHPNDPPDEFSRAKSRAYNRRARANPEIRERQYARCRARYANDPVYRERVLQRQRESRARNRAAFNARQNEVRRARKGQKRRGAAERIPTTPITGDISVTRDGVTTVVSQTTFRRDPLRGGVAA